MVRKETIFKIIILVFVLVFIEVTSHIVLKIFFPKHAIVRQILLGTSDATLLHAHNSIGQPYLNYIPAPGYKKNGLEQHNKHGYRGALVPLERSENTLRVLFLGGSTTYGWTVPHPDYTYPALSQKFLHERYVNQQKKYDKVEVINGGLMWGTTAEIVNHYLMKFRYYKPDIVVLNTGGNDGGPQSKIDNYHPDYSHRRKSLSELHPLKNRLKGLLYSKFISLFILNAFYDHWVKGEHFVKPSTAPKANWYSVKTENDGVYDVIPEDDLAFKNNLSTLVREILADGSELLLVPFRLGPKRLKNAKRIDHEIERNEKVMYDVAKKYKVPVAPFPANIISDENWMDHCHLNEQGSYQKAAHVSSYLFRTIEL